MINYGIINHSIEYYENCGFRRVESPWTVAQSISDITKPKECADFTIKEKDKVLVASGEQSFLALYNKGFLPPGQFQTVTPCFRDESFTPYHTKYFIKNELIKTDSTTLDDLMDIVYLARDFFRAYCLLPRENDQYVSVAGVPDDVIIKPWPYRKDAFDLEYRGHELGSYGIRQCAYLKWIYATGVAEPRLTRVLKTYGINSKQPAV